MSLAFFLTPLRGAGLQSPGGFVDTAQPDLLPTGAGDVDGLDHLPRANQFDLRSTGRVAAGNAHPRRPPDDLNLASGDHVAADVGTISSDVLAFNPFHAFHGAVSRLRKLG